MDPVDLPKYQFSNRSQLGSLVMVRIKARTYTLWCWFGCTLSTVFWATVSLAGSLVSSTGRLQHFCMRRWSIDNLWLSRVRVEIEGIEHIDSERPQILVANHSGLHDILSLAARLPLQFRWIAKKSLFKVPFMGWHMQRSGYIPIDRDNPREAARSIMEAAATIRSGVSAIAFPEGTRSRTGALGSFHSGAFALALRTGVPLLPVTLEGSYRVIVPKTLQVNPGTIIRIRIDKPIDLKAYGRAEKQRLMNDVHQIMGKNLEELGKRRRPGEEREDPMFRWIYGKSGGPDYESLLPKAETTAHGGTPTRR